MRSVAERLTDIKTSINALRAMLHGKSFAVAQADEVTRLAAARCVEIISEASRHIPNHMKQELGAGIPWRNVANTGNILRHAYHREEFEAIWAIYTDDLDPLEAAIDAMLAATPPAPRNS